jgi:hypothetical protein
VAREARGSVRRDEARGHMDGFEKAVARALDEASKSSLGTGDHDVEIHFGAHVSVTNPGVINEYVVRLVAPN